MCWWPRVIAPVDRDQRFLMPPDMREWLSADHPVWLVIAAIGQIDTSAFHHCSRPWRPWRWHRRTGGVGRAGYHPDMLLTLLVWAWAQGVRSSRRVERSCEQDVAFRVICAGDVPTAENWGTSMEFTACTCQCCTERREWDTLRAADAAAVRHLFGAHPVRWFAVAGGTVATDPPPMRLDRRLVRV